MLSMLLMLLFNLFLLLLLNNNQVFWLLKKSFFLMTFIFMVFKIPSFYMNSFMCYFLSIDYMSYGLILLSFLICTLMFLASEKVNYFNNNIIMFMLIIVLLMMFLYLSFSAMDLMLFYFFFESSLIPTLFLILGWGYQSERIQAGLYMLFYTLLASLPLLMSLMYLYKYNKSLLFMLLNKNLIYSYQLSLFYLTMLIAFLVKMPMFLVHLWLPKAHVEAPVSGSMILAGVLLKLGGYGLMRVLKMLMGLNSFINLYIISISLIGGFLICLNCLRQTDFKSLIAFSSVSHMGLVLSGIFSFFYWGLLGSYMMMIAHGLCSSGLFCLANICYERLESRSMLINKGLMNFMPSFSIWWFLLCSSNMAAPPTLNLLGEISLLNSIVVWSWLTMIMLFLISFFSAAYCLYLYSYSQHGLMYSSIYSFSSGNMREYFLLFLHWFPLNYLIIQSSFFILWI